jgi:hypothetical protein
VVCVTIKKDSPTKKKVISRQANVQKHLISGAHCTKDVGVGFKTNIKVQKHIQKVA